VDLQPILLFLHLLGGASWLGASLFANVVIVPYIEGRPRSEWPGLVARLVLGPERLVIASALTAGIAGILLGISSGRIASDDALVAPYGFVWLASIGVAGVVFTTGGLVTSRAAARLVGRVPSDPLGIARSAEKTDLRRLRLGFAVELAGIVTILGLMVVLGRS
jgi:hypothetical protein